jgi:hypothetical protein
VHDHVSEKEVIHLTLSEIHATVLGKDAFLLTGLYFCLMFTKFGGATYSIFNRSYNTRAGVTEGRRVLGPLLPAQSNGQKNGPQNEDFM